MNRHTQALLPAAGVLASCVLALAGPSTASAKFRVVLKPAAAHPGQKVTVVARGSTAKHCRLRVTNNGRTTLSRSVPRAYRLTIKAGSRAGSRKISVRCGRYAATARLRVLAPKAGHAELGAPPVVSGETDAFTLNKSVGGDFATRIPLDRGRQVRVTQAAGGPYSHGSQYTRNAVDLGVPAGTTVRGGFSGVIAVARGGCAASGSWGCNSGYGNFVYLKASDNTCAIYAHLTSIAVAVGQQVDRYTPVGAVGSSGSSTGPHLHTDRVDCSSNQSLPSAFAETGGVREGQVITSGNEPPPAPESPTPDPGAQPVTKVISVDNRVTNGMGMREDGTPARLTTKPWTYCGARLQHQRHRAFLRRHVRRAVCQTTGSVTTNGHDQAAADYATPNALSRRAITGCDSATVRSDTCRRRGSAPLTEAGSAFPPADHCATHGHPRSPACPGSLALRTAASRRSY